MLLATKFYPPRPPEPAIIRGRLFDRLSQARDSNCHILISAGAGFGKSTLTAHWIQHNNIPAAWISLDEHDNEPGRFFAYLAEALNRQYGVDTEPVHLLLKGRGSDALQPVLETLTDIILQIPHQVYVVLDDFHVIEQEAILRGIEFLMKYAGNSCPFIFLTRIDPPISLSRLRLDRKLAELREADLRFNDDEIQKLIGVSADDTSIRDELTGLFARKTEGWVVGLRLAMMAWQQENRDPDFLKRFSGTHHFVADYLMEEVLGNTGSETEELMLAASLFDRFNSGLLDSVLGRSTAADLNELVHSRFFLIPLDDHDTWFRFHHLTGELLRKRASGFWGREQVNSMLIRAAGWFGEQGLIDEALSALHRAEFFPEIIRIISTHGLRRIAAGELHTVSKWLQMVPDDELYSTADLCVISGWMAAIEQDIARQRFISERAESVFDEQANHYIADIRSHLALLRANYIIQDASTRPEDIRRLLKTAEQHLKSDNLLLKSILELYRGNFFRMTGELTLAQEAHGKTMLYAGQINDFSLLLPAATASVEILLLQGKFQEAEQMLAQTLDTVYQTFKKIRIPKVGLLHILLAMLYYEQNRLDESESELKKAEGISKQTNDYNALVMFYDLRARLHLIHHERDEARKNLDAAVELAKKRHLLYYSAYLVHLTFLLRKQSGNRIALEQCLELIEQNRSEFGLWLGQLELTRIKTLAELNRFDEALAEAQHLKEEAEKREAGYVAYQAGCLIASLHLKRGSRNRSIDVLPDVLEFASKTGAIRPLLDTGPDMAEAIKTFASVNGDSDSAVTPAFINALLASFAHEQKRTPAGLSEPLSERELEVLRLLASGLMNREIGERLYLAIGTVKKHSNAIYQKLGVKNRIQAVEKARELRII